MPESTAKTGEDLARLVTVRAAARPTQPAISIATGSPFQVELLGEQARHSPNLRQVARRHLAPLLKSWDGDVLGLPDFLGDAVAKKIAPAGLAEHARSQFQNLYPLFLDPATFQLMWSKLADSTLAAYILLDEYPLPLGSLIAAVRGAFAIELAGKGKTFDLMVVDDAQVVVPQPPPTSVNPYLTGLPRIGVMDLLTLKHHVVEYVRRDIAQLENVMSGETRMLNERETVTTERETTAEDETTKETDDELSVTDRFAFKREAETTTKEDLSIKAGLDIGYGSGGFHISANFGVDYSKSKEQVLKDASETAKEITRKSATKVSERHATSERRLSTVQRERIENHTLTNTPENDHIVGSFRALDAIHECALYTDSQRMIVDMMIPEPARFVIWSEQRDRALHPPTGPAKFVKLDGKPVLSADLSPTTEPAFELSRTEYYGTWVAEYGVQGVLPPPETHVSVVHAFTSVNEQGGNHAMTSGTLEIPSGYEATSVVVAGTFRNDDDETGNLSVNVTGAPVFNFVDAPEKNTNVFSSAWTSLATPSPGSVGFTILSEKAADVSVTIRVDCVLTAQAMASWADKTYAAIIGQYRKVLADYDEAQAAAIYTPKPLGVFGSSTPERNRRIEREEIKRSASAILLRRDLVGLDLAGVKPDPDATDDDPSLYPSPDLAKSEQTAAAARFVEQAFEWEKMGYIFYPYFWGRPATWRDALKLVNDDLTFQTFLQAGCARLVVPVRRGFEAAVAYVQATGEVPGPGLVPEIGDPDFVALWQETQAAYAQPTERVVRDEITGLPLVWEVTVPTGLRILETGLPTDLERWDFAV